LTELFGIFVNEFEEWPVTMTRTFPELNQVVFVHDKKPSKFFGDGSQVNLGWMDRRVKNKSCCMNGVSDNDDF